MGQELALIWTRSADDGLYLNPQKSKPTMFLWVKQNVEKCSKDMGLNNNDILILQLGFLATIIPVWVHFSTNV